MRKIDIFCSSPASTSICSSTVVRHAHDRSLHDHLISSQPSISPKPHRLDKSASSSRARKSSAAKHYESRRKSSADAYDLARRTTNPSHRRPGDSSRSLLTDSTASRFIDWSPDDVTTVPKLPPILTRRHNSAKEPTRLLLSQNHDSPKLVDSSSPSGQEQVVVLRVSLHCKGCEGKVRKHISKMEGVKSFSIEFDTKKVTVIGNVTASGVLESVSRVKNAQLWPSPTSSSSSSSTSSSSSSTTTPSLSSWPS